MRISDWSSDVCSSDLPRFNDEDIAALRTARQAVGDDLCYLGKPLPPADFLADVDSILAAHESLQKAAGIEQSIADGAAWRLASDHPATIASVEATEDRKRTRLNSRH